MTQTKNPFSTELLQEMVVGAIEKVLGVMTSLEPELESAHSDSSDQAPHPAIIKPGLPLFIGMVGFIGSANGYLYLYFEEKLANDLSRRLLGMEPGEEIDKETVVDAIGEISNMTVGSFKNRICEMGYECTLTIPTVMSGENFAITPNASATRQIYNFKLNGSSFSADLIIKPFN